MYKAEMWKENEGPNLRRISGFLWYTMGDEKQLSGGFLWAF